MQQRQALVRRLEELHPYEVPELLIFNVDDGLPAYLHWLDETSGNQDES